MAYSLDLRERVLEAFLEGNTSQRKLAKRFKVSSSFVTRLIKLYKETGSVVPRYSKPGPIPMMTEEDDLILKQLVYYNPDKVEEELELLFYQLTDKATSRSTIGRALRRLGLSKRDLKGRDRNYREMRELL